jgi:hypothetical protein
MERLNQHVGEGYKPRIGQKQHLKTIAQAAFKNIPGAQPLIERHFGTQVHPRGLIPAPQKNLVMHHGFDHSTH